MVFTRSLLRAEVPRTDGRSIGAARNRRQKAEEMAYVEVSMSIRCEINRTE